MESNPILGATPLASLTITGNSIARLNLVNFGAVHQGTMLSLSTAEQVLEQLKSAKTIYLSSRAPARAQGVTREEYIRTLFTINPEDAIGTLSDFCLTENNEITTLSAILTTTGSMGAIFKGTIEDAQAQGKTLHIGHVGMSRTDKTPTGPERVLASITYFTLSHLEG